MAAQTELGAAVTSAPALRAQTTRPAARLAGFAGRRPWRRVAVGDGEAWLAGHFHGLGDGQAVARLIAAGASSRAVAAALSGFDGHWAIALRAGARLIAAADRLRSWPLLIDKRDGGVVVAPCITDALSVDDVDPGQALACAMSGYAIGAATLYQNVQTLGPGQFVIAGDGGAPNRATYHRFRPWRGDARDGPKLANDLAETTLAVLQKTIDGLDGRQVAAPLSAGRDSRLIVSGLRHLGYKNIVCVAYGRPANRELAPSRAIAERLGLPWVFRPITQAGQRRHFGGALHRAFTAFADALDATPFLQDLPALAELLESGVIDRDAVVINGQTGDFISGNHIPAAVAHFDGDADPAARRRLIVEATLAKHYRLWRSLATPANDDAVAAMLDAAIDDEALAGAGSMAMAGAAEALEFHNRQVKYVAAGQRAYDFLGLDWRLPLWDLAYMDFWERAPLSAKLGQRLFADMLEARNWGGVWRDIPLNPPTGMAPWLRRLRFACKAAHAPLGRARWHDFERRYLSYWMEPLANQAINAYGRVAADRRGARNAVAWHTQAYLARHGLGYDGRPL